MSTWCQSTMLTMKTKYKRTDVNLILKPCRPTLRNNNVDDVNRINRARCRHDMNPILSYTALSTMSGILGLRCKWVNIEVRYKHFTDFISILRCWQYKLNTMHLGLSSELKKIERKKQQRSKKQNKLKTKWADDFNAILLAFKNTIKFLCHIFFF